MQINLKCMILNLKDYLILTIKTGVYKMSDAGKKRLFNPYDPNANGTIVKDKYGFLPLSIWSISKDKGLVEYVKDSIGEGSYSKKKGKKTPQGFQTLSLLNPTVVHNILMYYTEPEDVVLAPYTSRGVIGFVANLMGRHCFSTEIARPYWENVLDRARSVYQKNGRNGYAMEFYLDDAQYLKTIPDNFADLTYFNPPYWNQEKYYSTDGQMSDAQSYNDFLKMYSNAIKAKYRCTKYGGFAIANLNDFRQDYVFYNFHGDTICLMEEAGFVYHDMIINEIFSRSVTSVGSQEKRGLKIMAKSHEYIMVFKKPLKDNTVWRDYNNYRSNYRDNFDCKKQIMDWHNKIGFTPEHGYSWEW